MIAGTDSKLLALTNQVYDAACGALAWSDFGRALLEAFDAATGTIMLGSRTAQARDILFRADLPLDAVTAYNAHFCKVLWTTRAAAAVLDEGHACGAGVWTSGTLVPDAEFLRSEFYGDFGRALGLRYVLGTVIVIDATRMMPIGLHRPDRSRPFEPIHLAMFAHLIPHLRRSMQLSELMRSPVGPKYGPEASGLAALDALENGVMVVDVDMRILVSNAAAEAMMRPGGVLRGRRTRTAESLATVVGACHRTDGAKLAKVVRATAVTGGAGGVIALRDADGVPAVAAVVAPLSGRFSGDANGPGRIDGQALLVLRAMRAEKRPVSTELLCDLFGLTRAEAEVARALMGGATKEAVAAERHSQETTVRTQVRAILAKTGALNLRDLERMIARLQ